MSRDDKIKIFEEEINKLENRRVTPEQFTNKFLSKRLWQYRKVRLGRVPEKEKLYVLADIYLNLHNFAREVEETLKEVATEIFSELKNKGRTSEEEAVYLPDSTKKLEILVGNEGVLSVNLKPMEDPGDWKKALQQERDRVSGRG